MSRSTPRSGILLCGVLAGLLALPGMLQAQRGGSAPPSVELTPAQRDSVVALARAQIGHRYRLGGERPDEGFDCSGLVRHILSAFDLRLPRTAALQALFGREVPRDRAELRPGDILTFGRGNRITHVGIYVGDSRFVHASTSTRQVVESSLNQSQSSLVRSWRGVRRVFAAADSIPAPAPSVVNPIVVSQPLSRATP
jgi:cell wall-associated NlpC family hydrolase